VLRSFRRKESLESASVEEEEEEDDEGEEGVWVEKTIRRDGDTAFVGPVPEIKVQATVTKKE
jgi:hypothetical protein